MCVAEVKLELESQKMSACRHSHSGARAMIRQAPLVKVPQLGQAQLSRHDFTSSLKREPRTIHFGSRGNRVRHDSRQLHRDASCRMPGRVVDMLHRY